MTLLSSTPFIHGWEFSIYGWFWQMKILSIVKIFSSIDGTFIHNLFGSESYASSFQTSLLLHRIFIKILKNENSIHGWKDLICGQNLYPSKWFMNEKISFLDRKISSMIKLSSLEILMDDFFISGHHSWMKSTDKRQWMVNMDSALQLHCVQL